MTAYAELLNIYKEISIFEEVSQLLSWDQETKMPPKGVTQRGAQKAALASLILTKSQDRKIADLLETALSDESLDRENPIVAANLREIKRRYKRMKNVPPKLAAEIAKTTTEAHLAWADARAAQDFQRFAPKLKAIVELKRQEAEAIRSDEACLYDVLLGDFEAGMSADDLTAIFDELRPASRDLRAQIAEKTQIAPLEGHFPRVAQIELSETLAQMFQYDMEAGRIDFSIHPFSTGNFDDSRITTRIDEADVLNCLYSTIHEVGHSVYEQGISRDLMYVPAGVYASMGVHESQSRYFENQIARSRSFMDVLYPKLNAAFPTLETGSPDMLYRQINRVSTGFIRTEADELHYNLHVMLRFGLERDIFDGSLAVEDLEDEWNSRFKADFGLDVPNAALGVLQDVHWSEGLFGYFPTYSLGNIYATCLDEAIRQAIPDLDQDVANGDMTGWVAWLRTNIHQHGRVYLAKDLIESATKSPISPQPLIRYLNRKYGELYDL